MDIKDKTLFDYMSEKDAFAFMGVPSILGRNAVEQHLRENPAINASHLIDYAVRIGNNKLKKQIEKAFAKELNQHFNE